MSDDPPRSSAREVWVDAAGHNVNLRLQEGHKNLALGHKIPHGFCLGHCECHARSQGLLLQGH